MALVVPTLILAGMLLMISAFFSCTETALIAIRKIRLRHLVMRGTPRARMAQHLVTHLDQVITTILVSNNLVNVAISALGTIICVTFWGPQWGVAAATVFVTMILLVFGEITPKIFATLHAERITLAVAPFLTMLIRLLRPATWFFSGVSYGIIRLLGGHPAKRNPLVTEEEIRLMIEIGKEEGLLSDEERRMLHQIFEFGDTLARDVMVPREQMVCLSIRSTPEQVLQLLVEEGHSRIPVYEGDVDHIRGILYARDILYLWKNQQLLVLEDLLHTAFFVPAQRRVNEVLRDFQRLHVQMAIVQDEDLQRTIGLVTAEDLLEEIVGEIEEE